MSKYNNYPASWFDWLEAVRQLREEAKTEFAAHLKGAREVAEQMAATAYPLFRMRQDATIAELVKGELKPFLDKNNLNDARAFIRYTINAILEPQDARTAMNLLTEMGSAVEYLEILEETETEGWEPYPLTIQAVREKIASYDPERKGRALFNLTSHYNSSKESDTLRLFREKDAAQNRADNAEARADNIPVEEVRRRRIKQSKDAANAKRMPRIIKRMRQISQDLAAFNAAGGVEDQVRFAFQVGTDPWVMGNDSMVDHLMNSLMMYQPKSTLEAA